MEHNDYYTHDEAQRRFEPSTSSSGSRDFSHPARPSKSFRGLSLSPYEAMGMTVTPPSPSPSLSSAHSFSASSASWDAQETMGSGAHGNGNGGNGSGFVRAAPPGYAGGVMPPHSHPHAAHTLSHTLPHTHTQAVPHTHSHSLPQMAPHYGGFVPVPLDYSRYPDRLYANMVPAGDPFYGPLGSRSAPHPRSSAARLTPHNSFTQHASSASRDAQDFTHHTSTGSSYGSTSHSMSLSSASGNVGFPVNGSIVNGPPNGSFGINVPSHNGSHGSNVSYSHPNGSGPNGSNSSNSNGSNYANPNGSNGSHGPNGSIVPSNGSLNGSLNGSHGPSNGSSSSSNAQGRAINKMLLEILRERTIDPIRLSQTIDSHVMRMDCVNLATLLFHTGKKRFSLPAQHVQRIAVRFNALREELRAREASNALYGMKCLSSAESEENRALLYALANKLSLSPSEFAAQAVGNALYGLQNCTSDCEEVRYLLLVLSAKVHGCTERLEAQNVGNALYGLRGMSSDHREVRALVAALSEKISTAKEELNGQALGNALYGLQSMSARESEVRALLTTLSHKVRTTWEELKAQEVGNALYGLKRMSSEVCEVRALVAALVPKIASSPDLLDAQAVGNSFYGLQNMTSEHMEIRALLSVLAEKVNGSNPELDGQAMGNALYGLQGMCCTAPEVRRCVAALTEKILSSSLEMNAQELGNALYGLHSMTSDTVEVCALLGALAKKARASRHELTSQEIGNALFGLQRMRADRPETRLLLAALARKISLSHSALDPQGVSNALFGLQRLSSECHEVRCVVSALAEKTSLCWKHLSAHHVAHALFGIQRLSGVERETRLLITALVPKVLACREEMTARQLAHALYGLQSLSLSVSLSHDTERDRERDVAAALGLSLSHNALSPSDTSSAVLISHACSTAEVQGVLNVLTEKLCASSEVLSWPLAALALFGLQGMDESTEEVALLLREIVRKLSLSPSTAEGVASTATVADTSSVVALCGGVVADESLSQSLSETEREAQRESARCLANALFGLQRMRGDIPEVVHLVTLLCAATQRALTTPPAPLTQPATPSAVSPQSLSFSLSLEALTPSVVSRALTGLQSLSVRVEAVRALLSLLLDALALHIDRARIFIESRITSSSDVTCKGDKEVLEVVLELLYAWQSASVTLCGMEDLGLSLSLCETIGTGSSTTAVVPPTQYPELCTHAARTLHSLDALLRERDPLVRAANSLGSAARPHTVAEEMLFEEVRAALPKECELARRALVRGHEIGLLLQFTHQDSVAVDVSSLPQSKNTSSAVLVEFVGSRYTFPAHELLFRRRNAFLKREVGLCVRSVSAEHLLGCGGPGVAAALLNALGVSLPNGFISRPAVAPLPRECWDDELSLSASPSLFVSHSMSEGEGCETAPLNALSQLTQRWLGVLPRGLSLSAAPPGDRNRERGGAFAKRERARDRDQDRERERATTLSLSHSQSLSQSHTPLSLSRENSFSLRERERDAQASQLAITTPFLSHSQRHGNNHTTLSHNAPSQHTTRVGRAQRDRERDRDAQLLRSHSAHSAHNGAPHNAFSQDTLFDHFGLPLIAQDGEFSNSFDQTVSSLNGSTNGSMGNGRFNAFDEFQPYPSAFSLVNSSVARSVAAAGGAGIDPLRAADGIASQCDLSVSLSQPNTSSVAAAASFNGSPSALNGTSSPFLREREFARRTPRSVSTALPTALALSTATSSGVASGANSLSSLEFCRSLSEDDFSDAERDRERERERLQSDDDALLSLSRSRFVPSGVGSVGNGSLSVSSVTGRSGGAPGLTAPSHNAFAQLSSSPHSFLSSVHAHNALSHSHSLSAPHTPRDRETHREGVLCGGGEADDDELEELEKKLEIAKLEARIQDLKNRKTRRHTQHTHNVHNAHPHNAQHRHSATASPHTTGSLSDNSFSSQM